MKNFLGKHSGGVADEQANGHLTAVTSSLKNAVCSRLLRQRFIDFHYKYQKRKCQDFFNTSAYIQVTGMSLFLPNPYKFGIVFRICMSEVPISGNGPLRSELYLDHLMQLYLRNGEACLSAGIFKINGNILRNESDGLRLAALTAAFTS